MIRSIFFISRIIFITVFLAAKSAVPAGAQNAERFFEDGNKYLAQKKYKDAVNSFSKAINENDHTAAYYLKRGIAHTYMKETQKSYNDLTSAIKYDYTLGEAYYFRALILAASSMHQDAVNDCDMLIKYPPGDSLLYMGYLLRGENRQYIRNYKGAFDDCLKYYQHDTSSVPALTSLALAKNDMNQPDSALGYLYKILAMHPTDSSALMNVGFINISLERWDTAYKYLEKATKTNPKEPYGFSNLSFVKMKKGDNKGAMRDVNYSLSLNADNSWAYRNRALIYMASGDTAKACDDLKTAIHKGYTDRYGNEVSDLIYKHCEKK